MENNPSYFVQIPGLVIQDKTITPYAKLLFGIVQGLCNVEGYCYASSDYLAERLGVTDRAIRNYVVELLNAGHIRVERTETNKRKIYLETKLVPGRKPEKQIKIEAEQTFQEEKVSENSFQPSEQTFRDNGTGIPNERNKHSNNNIKENIKYNIKEKEREEDTPAKFKEVIKAKDPLFPECQMSDGEMVMTVIQEFLDEHWNRMAVDRHSLRDCQDIFDKLREEDKVAQLKRCLILHTYGTIDGQKKTFWSKTPPQPKFLKLNWNDIYSAKIPIWFERGFTSQAEYEADIIKTQPSSHSGMDDLKRQFFSGPMVSQERADQFMIEMDELKEKINGKT